MKKLVEIILFLLILPVYGHSQVMITVDDFNSGKYTNLLGGNSGCWSSNASDLSQYCKAEFAEDIRLDKDGHSLRLDYDVDTPLTSDSNFPRFGSNGYFTQFKRTNLKQFDYLIINVKGDSKKGFTRKIVIEIKNPYQTSRYVVEGITSSWRKFAIPLWSFKDIRDWTTIREIAIVFDHEVTRKEGTVYIDDIYFATEAERKEVKAPKANPGAGSKFARPDIDGDLGEWSNVKPIKINAKKDLQGGSVEGKNDLDASAYFMWDDENLYFAASVTDDRVLSRQEGENIYRDDCVELFLDPKDDGLVWGDTNDFQIGFAPCGPGEETQQWSWFQNTGSTDMIKSASASSEQQPGGRYQVEAAIPWKFLKVNPREGMILGVSPAIHDQDDTSEESGKVIWSYFPISGKIILGELILWK